MRIKLKIVKGETNILSQRRDNNKHFKAAVIYFCDLQMFIMLSELILGLFLSGFASFLVKLSCRIVSLLLILLFNPNISTVDLVFLQFISAHQSHYDPKLWLHTQRSLVVRYKVKCIISTATRGLLQLYSPADSVTLSMQYYAVMF